ncbi:PTS system lactose cellobiose-specific iic component [Lacticaseibacillus thailandensis DSM 22698 = JCM 13996]|uniref:Permease IIC component n=3 Tax=Lacticaseibacillus thailandensis TaxID=381741 RepID=A0A0R2CI55_9LACO|nr:PTS system lactose cellobiose-specific iic component [Lacticaseibacillus thailandensis DSM 22698 = JCM 13996]
MVAMTPLLIIGSFALIPSAIPNMIGKNNIISQWIIHYGDVITIPSTVGMSMMALYVSAVIAYHLAESKHLDVPGCISMAVMSFLILAVDFTKAGAVDVTYFGTKGLFVSMFGSILAVEIFGWCKKRNFTIKMPDSVPDFVSKSFEMIPISIITVAAFVILRVICVDFLHTLPPMIFTNILAPLVGSMDNPFAYTFVKFLQALLFFFGIHPAVLSPITSPISTQFLAENIANAKAGLALTHFFTPGPDSAFGNFTGTGVTFGLVFWFMFSKAAAQKKIGRIALIPALFGINEPILFGAPVVLNPLFFIPFVILGPITSSFGAWAMSLGWLKMSVFTPPYVGVFLEGYLATFDWRSLLVNGAQMLFSILIWYPFCKMAERNELKKEKERSQNKKAISDEDEALIDDLDLDF